MNIEKKIKLPSNRNFGIVFSMVFLLISVWPVLNGLEIRIWSLLISIVFLILGILNSNILKPLNIIWMKFGVFLGNFISPIVMMIVFFFVITPTSLILKLFRKDILNLKKNKDESYWIERSGKLNNMKNQF